MKTTIEKINLEYHGKRVLGRRLKVISEIPLSIDTAWNEVQKSTTLEFVTKGFVSFKPLKGRFPEFWEEGMEVHTRILLYGFLPFGGVHILYFVKIDAQNHEILTREKDSAAKIWNHKISIKQIELEGRTVYTDEVDIYGGPFTAFLTIWAKRFYKHRQKRWHLITEK